jgi:16S rRNA (guanine966-N2)-methyltransferase
MEEKATVFATDCVRAAHMINEKQADFIFMDPPYGKGLETELLASLLKCPYVTEDTVIIVEADIKEDLSGIESLGYSIVREKEYKTNKHVFLVRK